MWARIAALTVAVCVSGCWPSQLSMEEQNLLDAVALVKEQVEDGHRWFGQMKFTPIKRTVIDNSITYSTSTSEGHVPITIEISQPEKCVFQLRSSETAEQPILNLNNATVFEVRMTTRGLIEAVLEGKDAFCIKKDCVTTETWLINFDLGEGQSAKETLFNRYRRAIAFIKKSCPGKPF